MKFKFTPSNNVTKFPILDRKKTLLLSILYLTTVLVNLNFRAKIPVLASFSSPHDDQLGVELASNILSGDWLGVWNNRTLAKPAGYSLYLAMAHFIPIDLAILSQILYITATALFLILAQRFLVGSNKFKDIAVYLIFIFLIFQPILFDPGANRIYRSSVPNMVLTLTFSILLLSVFEKISYLPDFINLTLKKRVKFYLLVSAVSFTYASMVLFRYESFWIIICSIPPLVLLLIFKFRSINRNKENRIAFVKFFAPVPFLLVLIYTLPIVAVQESNKSSFGVPLTENYFQGSFSDAINLWASVDVGRDPRPYVVVSADQRSAVYEISSTASLLKPFLEDTNSGWNAPACNLIKLCDNSGGWFTWQTRDAAMQTGYVYSERTFQHFFKSIATDIQKACDRSQFNCVRESSIVGSKPLQEIPKKQMVEHSIENFRLLLPLKFQNKLLLSRTDNFGASEEVVNLYHHVVNYQTSQSYNEADLKKTSKVFERISNVYVVLNWAIFLLALAGIFLYWQRGMRLHIKTIFVFLSLGVTSQLIGAGIANISFGSAPTALYLLSAYPMLHLIDALGIISLINYLKIKRTYSHVSTN